MAIRDMQSATSSPRRITLDRLRIGLLLANTLIFGVLGQHYLIELPEYKLDAVIFFAISGLSFGRVLVRSGVFTRPAPRPHEPPVEPFSSRGLLVYAALALAALAFFNLARNTFTRIGTLAWLGAVLTFLVAMWPPLPAITLPHWSCASLREGLTLRVKWHTLALIAILLLAAFFRLYRLDQVPPEMTSDHIEKLLDIHDLYDGVRPIYFERNTGREPFQFYWAFTVIRLFDTGGTFYGLKLANALIGIIAVYGIYLFGRELAGGNIGLLAAFFASVMQWAESITRMALRFPYVTVGAAFALWAITRALRTGRRGDYLIAGLIFGAGFFGYTAYRVMPAALIVMIALQLVFERPRTRQAWRQWIINLVVFVWIAALVFLPLARYWSDRPQMFWSRSMTRLEGDYGVTPQNVGLTLAHNTLRALGMFNVVGDTVWANTVAGKPALDQVGGAIFLLGVMAALYRIIKHRDWPWLMAILSGIVLLIPSILSVAFPAENPSVVRTAGAIPVVAIIVGLGLNVIARAAQELGGTRWGRWSAIVILSIVLAATTAINYRRYFDEYYHSYQLSSQNSSEMAEAMRGFIATGGDLQHIVIRAWPHWVDTRALALLMNDVHWQDTNVVIDKVNDLARMRNDPAPQLYLLHQEDLASVGVLKQAFPQGYLTRYPSTIPGHDFLLFHVPGK